MTVVSGSSTVPVTSTGFENSTLPVLGEVIATIGGGSNAMSSSTLLEFPARSVATTSIALLPGTSGSEQAKSGSTNVASTSLHRTLSTPESASLTATESVTSGSETTVPSPGSTFEIAGDARQS